MNWIWRGLGLGVGIAFARPLIDLAITILGDGEDKARTEDFERQAAILAPAIARAIKEAS